MAEMVAREREERVGREEFRYRLECQRESFQLRAALTEALLYAEQLREAVESYTEYTDYNGKAWCSTCLTEWSTDGDEPAHTNDCLASTSHIEKLKGALE